MKAFSKKEIANLIKAALDRTIDKTKIHIAAAKLRNSKRIAFEETCKSIGALNLYEEIRAEFGLKPKKEKEKPTYFSFSCTCGMVVVHNDYNMFLSEVLKHYNDSHYRKDIRKIGKVREKVRAKK